MPKQVQLRRGSAAEHAAFTGAPGEVTYNTDTKALHTHDGATAGGVALARSGAADVRDFGAVGSGTDDDTAAVTAAFATGKPVYFPAGIYLITSQITITTAKQCVFGDGQQSIIRRANAVGVNVVFYATAISDIRFTSLRFEVASDTTSDQSGGFIVAASCENLTVDMCQFMCANGTGLPTLFSCVNTPSCNNVLIHGNLFYRVYGNCCGANDGVGSGVNGNHVIVSNNRIIDSIDTGIGAWTGAREVVIVGNVLTCTYAGVAYSKVGIDTAGAARVTITGNSVDGYTIGVRVLTNINYTNQDIVISSNVFGNHRTDTGELAQAIKISHDDFSGGGSPTASVAIVNNSFTLSGSPEYGVDIISSVTDTAKKLTVRVDGNTFRKTGGTATAILFQKLLTYGSVDFIPGENAFVGIDTPVSGNYPDAVASTIGGQNGVWSRDEFTLTGSATLDFGRMYLKPGFYGLFASFGTMTDASGVGASAAIETYPGAVSVSGTVFNAALQDTSLICLFIKVTAAGQYQLRWFPHPAGHTHQIRSMSLVRFV